MMQIIDNIPFVEEPKSAVGQPSDHMITIAELRQMFNAAPEYRKFYSVTEAIDLCNSIVPSGKPTLRKGMHLAPFGPHGL